MQQKDGLFVKSNLLNFFKKTTQHIVEWRSYLASQGLLFHD